MEDNDTLQESEHLKKAQAKMDDEHVLLTAYQHPFGLILIYLITIVGLIGAFILLGWFLPEDIKNSQSAYSVFSGVVILAIILVGLLLIAITYVYKSTKLVLTNKAIQQVLQRALLQRKTMRFSLADIEDVTSGQKGIFAIMFNYGTLNIETAGQLPNPTFNNCPNPNKVAEIILQAKDDLEHGDNTP